MATRPIAAAEPVRSAIRFLLDGRVRTVSGGDPTETVLEYLRNREDRRGTKEGCAEGDCGACTVALGECIDGRLRYRAVNACILFLPAIDGKALVTVESLAADDGTPHPVQQAMIDRHASQCGFCTPGFVMSLFALWHEAREIPDRKQIDETLAGNLCRCTGYAPIAAAAIQAIGRRPAADDGVLERLKSIEPNGTLGYGPADRPFFAPTTIDALAELCTLHPEATLLAGGTDVGIWVTKHLKRLGTIIYLGRVAELATIEIGDDAIEIGAGATYSDAMAALLAHYPELGDMLRRLGSVQIRNSGTIGGNMANGSPIGDSMPALMALDTVLILRHGDRRRSLPLDQFFVGYRRTALDPGEFVERIQVPLREPDSHYRVYKIAKRFDQDISAICAGFSVTLEGDRVVQARLCFGGMAATPIRAKRSEAALAGARWSAVTIDGILPILDAELQPISDMRASAAYRRLLARNLLRKFHMETTERTRSLHMLDTEASLS